jgi:hypothetical protein
MPHRSVSTNKSTRIRTMMTLSVNSLGVGARAIGLFTHQKTSRGLDTSGRLTKWMSQWGVQTEQSKPPKRRGDWQSPHRSGAPEIFIH